MSFSRTPSEGPATPVELSTTQPGTHASSRLDLPISNHSNTMRAVNSSTIKRSFSITPPPSSQIPNMASTRRSNTPEARVLSSPPPTVNGDRRAGESVDNDGPSDNQIGSASIEKLREMLEKSLEDNNRLEMIAGEARMSAAHYKLQHNLLTIESENVLRRMEVEHDITRREVQVLQSNGRDLSPFEYTQQLKNWCKEMKDENTALRRRLNKAKKFIEQRDDELADSKETIARLHDRIRQNREHINELRSPGGPLHISTPKTAPATPYQHQYRGTPRYTPNTNQSIQYREHIPENNFNALLLAGAVLSQENNSAPSTPAVARHALPRTPNRHNRNVQSLSSLANSSGSNRPTTGNSTLLPSAQFSPEADARVASTLSHHVMQQQQQHPRERRRKSRDSTISASDADEMERSSYRQESEEIHESQASQSATEMLRIDPRESFEVAASRTHTPVPGDKVQLQQAKIFGAVTKRKREEEMGALKRARREGEGVGLGIGFGTRM